MLAIAFGSLWATLLPLFTAVLALGCGLSLTGLLAHAIDIATFSPTLATLIGLGVGIDYSLFVVTRHRNAITAGRDPEAACVRAMNTSGRAVLFAGATVIVALLGLFVLGVSFLNGVAVASAIVVLTTMTAAVTLIPALLGMFGMRVLSRKERRRLEAEGPRDPKLDGFWPRWAKFVQEHRLPLAVAALIVMLALAVPALSLRLGSSDAGQDPESSTTRKAYDLLADGLRAGLQRHLPDRRQDAERQGGPAEGAAARRHPRLHRRPGGGEPAGAEPERQDRADRGAARDRAPGRRDQRADRHAARRRRPEARRAGWPSTSAGSRRSSTTSPGC